MWHRWTVKARRALSFVKGEATPWPLFTGKARQVIFFAKEEAVQLGQNLVGTEHLLLGLIRDSDSVASRILDGLGLSELQVRKVIESRVVQGAADSSVEMQLAPNGKRVIDCAHEEARLLTNEYIGTEHLLLGLLREGEGLAARVLGELGVNLGMVRSAVYELQQVAPLKVDRTPDPSDSA